MRGGTMKPGLVKMEQMFKVQGSDLITPELVFMD
jgi:hypothetical protein